MRTLVQSAISIYSSAKKTYLNVDLNERVKEWQPLRYVVTGSFPNADAMSSTDRRRETSLSLRHALELVNTINVRCCSRRIDKRLTGARNWRVVAIRASVSTRHMSDFAHVVSTSNRSTRTRNGRLSSAPVAHEYSQNTSPYSTTSRYYDHLD